MKKDFKKWARAAGIRAIKTWAQAAAGALIGSHVMADVNWKVVLSTATLAAIASLLTSLKGLPEIEE